MIGNKAEQVMDAMQSTAERVVREIAPGPHLGIVSSVSGSVAQVVIDGDHAATPVSAFCPGLAAGKRVLLIRDKTQWYVIGVRQ